MCSTPYSSPIWNAACARPTRLRSSPTRNVRGRSRRNVTSFTRRSSWSMTMAPGEFARGWVGHWWPTTEISTGSFCKTSATERRSRGSLSLHQASKRMLMLACQRKHGIDFRLRHVLRIDAAFALPFVVDPQHELHRILVVHIEYVLQHVHHEFHRGLVVVEEHDAPHRRHGAAAGFRIARLGHRTASLIGRPGGPREIWK